MSNQRETPLCRAGVEPPNFFLYLYVLSMGASRLN